MTQADLLADLTEPQREAVMHAEGPLLVLAGAGSGKTRVITRRAAYLAETVTQPWHVLAITFTNKAAEEMKDRVAALGIDRSMLVCTFHSLCARLLRQHADRAGLSRSFSVFDQADRKTAIKQAIARCDLSEQNWRPASVESSISRAKNQMMTPAEFLERASDFGAKTLGRIYECYEQVMAEQQALDFDDLLLRAASMLGRDVELRDRLEERFQYVLVDEYQDTNHAQYVIARALSRDRHNLCATGDPDQSIYGWRGADLNNIMEFERDFPDARVVRLEQNYRSTKRILSVANAVIQANTIRKEKELWTENPAGPAVQIRECRDGITEAQFVAAQIGDLHAEGRPYRDIAVFYRVNALSRVLEDALRKEHIPYRIARGVEFYNRKEIKDTVAYLRVLANPADEVSLMRIINVPPRGIGATTVEKLLARARASGHSLFEMLHDLEARRAVPRAAVKLARFCELMQGLANHESDSLSELLKRTVRLTGLEAHYQGEEQSDSEQWENISELISAAAEFQEREEDATLVDFLTQVSLVSDADMIDQEAGAVTLMTLHAAKGLEFPVVFITGLEDDILPHARREMGIDDLEEERRLFFVGLTRAMGRLFLTRARQRMMYGQSSPAVASRFLHQLPESDVEFEAEPGSRRANGADGPSLQPEEFDDWGEGQWVRHPEYGIGVLQYIQRSGNSTRAAVRFRSAGQRSFMLEYSELQRIEPEDVPQEYPD